VHERWIADLADAVDAAVAAGATPAEDRLAFAVRFLTALDGWRCTSSPATSAAPRRASWR
jgi:hypothetical protein